jgi:2'-5' RNA ligase
MPARDPAPPQPGRIVAKRGPVRGPNPGREAAPPTIRCFVALQPDEAALERLDQLAREQHARFPSARRMRRENLHLTLAFIGALAADRAQQVAARLAAEPIAPFDWSVDSVGAFAGARVLWVGGTDAQLDALAARARGLLDELDVRFDRKPFVAHVTVLRNVPREAARDVTQRIEPPILWHAAAPVLLESRTDSNGVHYEPVTVPADNG